VQLGGCRSDWHSGYVGEVRVAEDFGLAACQSAAAHRVASCTLPVGRPLILRNVKAAVYLTSSLRSSSAARSSAGRAASAAGGPMPRRAMHAPIRELSASFSSRVSSSGTAIAACDPISPIACAARARTNSSPSRSAASSAGRLGRTPTGLRGPCAASRARIRMSRGRRLRPAAAAATDSIAKLGWPQIAPPFSLHIHLRRLIRKRRDLLPRIPEFQMTALADAVHVVASIQHRLGIVTIGRGQH